MTMNRSEVSRSLAKAIAEGHKAGETGWTYKEPGEIGVN